MSEQEFRNAVLEEAAQACDEHAYNMQGTGQQIGAELCAEAIRAKILPVQNSEGKQAFDNMFQESNEAFGKMGSMNKETVSSAAIRNAALEEAAAICDDEYRIRADAGTHHPEGSEERYRCFSAARASSNCAKGIRALQSSPAPKQETAAVRDVLAERQRQQDVEGWTPEHDDEHADGQMAQAAACYALYDFGVPGATLIDGIGTLWPWDWAWLKPKDRRDNLKRAAALIIAEMERIDRAVIAQSPDAGKE